MKEKIKKNLLTSVFLYVFLFFTLFIFIFSSVNAETSTIEQTNPLNSFNFLEYFSEQQNELAKLNRDYLAIALMIIFAFLSLLGILLYLFNIRPSQEEIKEQKKDLKLTKGKLEEKILKQERDFKTLEETIRAIQADASDRIDYLTSEFQEQNKKSKEILEKNLNTEIEKSKAIIENLKKEIDKKNSILEKNYQNLDLDTSWNEQYLWSTAGVHINRLTTLIEYLEKGIKYNNFSLFDLCFQNISKTIDKINPEDYSPKTYSALIKTFGRIGGFDAQKKEISKKVEKLISERGK